MQQSNSSLCPGTLIEGPLGFCHRQTVGRWLRTVACARLVRRDRFARKGIDLYLCGERLEREEDQGEGCVVVAVAVVGWSSRLGLSLVEFVQVVDFGRKGFLGKVCLTRGCWKTWWWVEGGVYELIVCQMCWI